ncbi:serine hydrolase domain-containing protein [Botrimarina hoheduenensis]|uniref:Esterase EstB n=1 Tax=Botrimarina hoheduenensis TaxID=2528000 RepID=A0A5C5WDR0_9BACT|nr:serine hydrolase domain-containing protein [Botrimarina hoheduenensis]TWT48834.1 Esterase EstB [Botrimarina hoheduenensis]
MFPRLAWSVCLLSCISAARAAEPVALGLDTARLGAINAPIEEARAAGQFSGCVVAIGRRGGVALLKAYGDRQIEPTRIAMTTDTVFDLASLTKPVATATSVMLLVEAGQLRLRDKMVDRLAGVTAAGGQAITIEQLLTHSAGYIPDNALADYEHGPDEAWHRLLALEPRWSPGTTFKYSDVGFELLGKIVEEVSGRPLNEFAKDRVFTPLGMVDTGYLPAAERRARAATTEQRDGAWLTGEVHDPRAALLGGVAGHAGLFSTAADLARYARCLLNGGTLDGVRLLSPQGLNEMIRARDVAGQKRALGWDVQSDYSSNRGELFSAAAFGHGGFTGTALWVDPELDLFVIFLSSRLHPDGEGNVNDLAGRIGTIAAAAILPVEK